MTLSPRWRRTAAIAALAALLVAAAIGATRWWGARTPAPTPAAVAGDGASPYDEARELMVSRQVAARGVDDPAVLAAMRAVPRHEYVPAEYLPQAYEDHPVSIGYGQTISQPYIVGLMTALLQLEPGDSVLEIGTGSGYQAAVLAEITPHVVSVEIVPELCELARTRLAARYGERVKVLCADGYYGWADDAPYDAVIVTCAPDHIPQPLVNQLADGGRMVIPVGPPGMYQVLWLVERQGETITTEQITGVIFVPLVRQAP